MKEYFSNLNYYLTYGEENQIQTKELNKVTTLKKEIIICIILDLYEIIYFNRSLFFKIFFWLTIILWNIPNILNFIVLPIINSEFIKTNELINISKNTYEDLVFYSNLNFLTEIKQKISLIIAIASFVFPTLGMSSFGVQSDHIYDALFAFSISWYNFFIYSNFTSNFLIMIIVFIFPIIGIISLRNKKYNNSYFSHEFLTLFVIIISFFFFLAITFITANNFSNLFVNYSKISLSFVILTHILCFICIILVNQSIKYKKNYYYILIMSCLMILTPLFLTNDLIIFYVLFELILLPIFFLIIIWGSRLRKLHAGIQFFLYTLVGSLLFLIGIIYLHINYNTTNIEILNNINISNSDQKILWLLFFLAFGIKVPIYPFHLWLPEAHVEAPTTGSVLLAGILLKLGTYGFLVFFFYLLPYASLFFLPIINMLCVLGIIYSSFAIIRQIDIKKIIAYSSVIHMNYTIIGLFNPNFLSFYGSFFLMLSHGIVSSALFICVGYIYERYHTRLIFYYGNLVMIMPILSIYFLLFTLGNIGFPGTSSFIGEFLIFIGVFEINKFVGLLLLFGLFISVIYSFLLYNKIFFYNSLNSSIQNIIFIKKFSDINKREHFILFLLLILMLFYGIYTKSFYNYFYTDLNSLYFNSKYKII